MRALLMDSNLIIDVFTNNPEWADWSESVLDQYGVSHTLCINPVIYSEVSVGFEKIEECEEALAGCGFKILEIPKEALFLAGKAFLKYRRRHGEKSSPLPDFYIGAHCAVHRLLLATRDAARMKTYFPTIQLVTP